MAGSCLLYNELHYNGLMTDLGLSPSSSSPHHVPLVSVTMLSPTPLRCSPLITPACTYHPPTCASKTSEIFPKISDVFRKKSNVFRKSSNIFRIISDVWKKSSNSPVLISRSSSPSISPITAPCFLLPHASVGTFHSPPKGLTLPPALFINISTQSAFLSRFSYTRTRVNRSLLLFSFTTFTDIPYNLL